MLHKVFGWLGFGEQGHGHGGHASAHGHGHTHGVVDPILATTARGIWAIKWSFVILGVTATLQLGMVVLSGSVALVADTFHKVGGAGKAVRLWVAVVFARGDAYIWLH